MALVCVLTAGGVTSAVQVFVVVLTVLVTTVFTVVWTRAVRSADRTLMSEMFGDAEEHAVQVLRQGVSAGCRKGR